MQTGRTLVTSENAISIGFSQIFTVMVLDSWMPDSSAAHKRRSTIYTGTNRTRKQPKHEP